MKTQTFLILQGRQRSHVFEMVMESRRRHVDHVCELLNTDRFFVVLFEPLNCFRYSIARQTACAKLSKVAALWICQCKIVEFSLNAWEHKVHVLRMFCETKES